MDTVRVMGMLIMLLGIAGMAWGAVESLDNRHSFEVGDRRITIVEERELPIQAIAGFGFFLVGVAVTLASPPDREVRHA